MRKNTVSAVIPSIPIRTRLRKRALTSIDAQTHPVDAVAVAIDYAREGAWVTRQRALEMAAASGTEWVAFLDDDDEWKSQHIRHCLKHALETDADFVYSWFDVAGGRDPFPSTHFTNAFDPTNPIETTITTLVKTELAMQVGFKRLNRGEVNSGEDRFFTLGCLEAGGKISHLVEKTWIWHHDSDNTSGLPTRW